MLQVNIHGPNDVRLDETPVPEPGPADALVRVQSCGICGSDLGYVKLGGLAGPTATPMPLGHELSAVVEAVGSEVQDVAPGDRVVVNPMGAGNQIGNGGPEGAFAPQLLVRNAAAGDSLFKIPDSLPDDLAALTEPIGVGMQAVNRAGAEPGDKVVIFGAGPIGLAALAVLRYRGVEDAVVVDLSPTRLEIADKLGARATVNAGEEDTWARIRELHGTEPVFGAPMAGTDAYIEASGASPLIGQVIGQAKGEARLSVVALHRAEVPVSFLVVMMKQLQISGSMAYPEDWSEMIELVDRADLSPMITHRFPLERFAEALAVAQDPTAGAKVLIEIG
ncbi:MAG: zinc-binding dehydrogenase [Deltaproteobacteria bacterium]|nr:zinc-binding dehydrogenase [Deltaproteobacteria bacterium]MBW2417975.1 zinc-binding dehydrogenase [Deltaproteobacteria bacterium]